MLITGFQSRISMNGEGRLGCHLLNNFINFSKVVEESPLVLACFFQTKRRVPRAVSLNDVSLGMLLL